MRETDLDVAFQSVAERIDPDAKLIRHWPLTGGVSAEIEAIELELPREKTRQLVVRRHLDTDWKSRKHDIMEMEFALLKILFHRGLPVPEPLLLDESALVLPSPYLVMAMVEGTTVVHKDELSDALCQMADFLLHLHGLDVETFEIPGLPDLEDPVVGALKYLPDTDAWAAIREAITSWQPAPTENVLLHGDFWPGNVLWSENQIAAVIDWEDASIGTAISDLACSRVEIMTMYGELAMETFTIHYLEQSSLNVTDLPLWEVYVSSAALATMADWNLDPEDEAIRRQRTSSFLHRAANEVTGRSLSDPVSFDREEPNLDRA